MRLRAHHGLCIQYFHGKGYSEEFVEKMQEVIGLLEEAPGMELTIVSDTDEICTGCPNLIEGNCTTCDKVGTMDQEVLRVLGRESGFKTTWDSYKAQVCKNILDTEAFHHICADCEWYGFCLSLRR